MKYPPAFFHIMYAGYRFHAGSDAYASKTGDMYPDLLKICQAWANIDQIFHEKRVFSQKNFEKFPN